MNQLSQIQTVAQKFKELREPLDLEKKKFDESVKHLSDIRKQINKQKESL